MTEDEMVLAYMATPEFAERARNLRIDIEAGHDISVVEMAQRLGLPGPFFAACIAHWGAFRTGQPVTVHWYDEEPETPVSPIPNVRPN